MSRTLTDCLRVSQSSHPEVTRSESVKCAQLMHKYLAWKHVQRVVQVPDLKCHQSDCMMIASAKITDCEVWEYIWVGVPDSAKNSHPLALGKCQQREKGWNDEPATYCLTIVFYPAERREGGESGGWTVLRGIQFPHWKSGQCLFDHANITHIL